MENVDGWETQVLIVVVVVVVLIVIAIIIFVIVKRLVQAHNEVKASLINEIRFDLIRIIITTIILTKTKTTTTRTLRKSLNPSTEQSFLEFQKSESLRQQLVVVIIDDDIVAVVVLVLVAKNIKIIIITTTGGRISENSDPKWLFEKRIGCDVWESTGYYYYYCYYNFYLY